MADISIQHVLNKLQTEVTEAKEKNSAGEGGKVRDHLIAIKALCELAIGEQPSSLSISKKAGASPVSSIQTFSNYQQGSPTNPPNKMEENDGSNGDSLFDF
ncbi:YwdI family protein [Bacillus sp. JZ8]